MESIAPSRRITRSRKRKVPAALTPVHATRPSLEEGAHVEVGGGTASGDPGRPHPQGPEPGPAAWRGPGALARAGDGWAVGGGGGIALPGVAPDAGEGVDLLRVGILGDPPPLPLLFAHRRGAAAAPRTDGCVGAHRADGHARVLGPGARESPPVAHRLTARPAPRGPWRAGGW